MQNLCLAILISPLKLTADRKLKKHAPNTWWLSSFTNLNHYPGRVRLWLPVSVWPSDSARQLHVWARPVTAPARRGRGGLGTDDSDRASESAGFRVWKSVRVYPTWNVNHPRAVCQPRLTRNARSGLCPVFLTFKFVRNTGHSFGFRLAECVRLIRWNRKSGVVPAIWIWIYSNILICGRFYN